MKEKEDRPKDGKDEKEDKKEKPKRELSAADKERHNASMKQSRETDSGTYVNLMNEYLN